MVSKEVARVRDAHGLTLQALPAAAQNTRSKIQQFTSTLRLELTQAGATIPESLDVVLLGSFGRNEVTAHSDCDYLVLVQGTPSPREIRRVIAAVESTRTFLDLKEHGASNTFGDFVAGTELFGRIGLESDSNTNTTRRLLLLMESVSVLNHSITESIRSAVLDRYLGDYEPGNDPAKPVRVPHFLLNDLTRYWRTMAVDFGAKQWRSLSLDWHLRHAKLLTTRKILFAGTLALLLDTERALRDVHAAEPLDAAAVHAGLTQHLTAGFAMSPLDRLLSVHDRLEPTGQRSLAHLLVAYDEFLGILDDPTKRQALGAGPGLERSHQARDDAKRIGDAIHEALLSVFFDDPLFASATRSFSLF